MSRTVIPFSTPVMTPRRRSSGLTTRFSSSMGRPEISHLQDTHRKQVHEHQCNPALMSCQAGDSGYSRRGHGAQGMLGPELPRHEALLDVE